MDESRRERTPATGAELTKFMEALGRYAFPLFTIERSRPRALGTGFFVQCEGLHFLVSAAHVIDVYRKNSLAYYVEGNDAEQPKGLIYTDYANFGDVGIIAIKGSARLPALGHFVDVSWLGDAPSENEEEGFLLPMGFPVTRNDPDPYRGTIQPMVVAVRGDRVPHQEYAKHRRDPKLQVLLRFDRQDMVNADRKRVVPPALHGMSGGPIFWLPNPSHPLPQEPLRIVGIVSSQDPKNRLLIGESWRQVRSYIELLARISRPIFPSVGTMGWS